MSFSGASRTPSSASNASSLRSSSLALGADGCLGTRGGGPVATRTPDLYRVKVDPAHWRGNCGLPRRALDLIRPQATSKPRLSRLRWESLLKQRDLGPRESRDDLVCPKLATPSPFGPRGTSSEDARWHQMAPPQKFRNRISLLFRQLRFSLVPMWSSALPVRRTNSEYGSLLSPRFGLLSRQPTAISFCFRLLPATLKL